MTDHAMTDRDFAPADADGFRLWTPRRDGRFIDSYGDLGVRIDGPGVVRVRCRVGHAQSNVSFNVHGGYILAFIDQAVFTGGFALGLFRPGGAVTLSASSIFLAPGIIDRALDAVVEMVAETGRMLFLRGFIEQGDTRVASFEATLRKVKRPARPVGEA